MWANQSCISISIITTITVTMVNLIIITSWSRWSMNGRAGSRRHGVWRVPLQATTRHTARTLVLVLLPALVLDPRFWRVSHISTTQHYYSDCIGTGTVCGTVTGIVVLFLVLMLALALFYWSTYMIIVIFSPRTTFWPKFVSTQEVRKRQQNRLRDKIA